MFRVYGDGADAFGVGEDLNAEFFQKKGSDGAGRNASDGFASGTAPSAPIVPKTIFLVKGIIGMPRPIIGSNFAVIR